MKHLKNWILAALLGVNIAGNVSAQTSQQPITVNWGTFNIRYDNPDDQENNWKFRKDRVATFIQQEKLDIVGMQEVLHNQLEDLKTRLPEYAEVGIGREDGKQQGEYAPIFYRKDRFKLLDSNTFWLSQYPDCVGFIGWDGACTRIATWAKLEEKSTGKIFLAVNTHMDHVGVEARRKGALLIIERIQEIVGNRPAVLTKRCIGSLPDTDHQQIRPERCLQDSRCERRGFLYLPRFRKNPDGRTGKDRLHLRHSTNQGEP